MVYTSSAEGSLASRFVTSCTCVNTRWQEIGCTEGGPVTGSAPRDEVDDLVAGWRSERPDLDLEPLYVLSRVSRLARHLDRARRTAFAAHGPEIWEFDVLSALRRYGEPE